MLSDYIYQLSEPKEILSRIFLEKKEKNPLFSLRAWSKKLGFKNPSLISDILNGRRRLTKELALKIIEQLDLTPDEQRYFLTLTYLSDAKNDEEREYFLDLLKQITPENKLNVIEDSKNHRLWDWYCSVLDEMPCLKDFKSDNSYLAKRLDPEISPHAVELAINELVRVGMIQKTQKGKWIRPRKNLFHPEKKDEIHHETHKKKKLRKFMEKASDALDFQAPRDTRYSYSAIPIKLKDLPKFQQHIRDFVESFDKLESRNDADEIYMVNVQFFRLTQPVTQS